MEDVIGARFVTILYHNNSHSEIIDLIRDNLDFMFDGKQTLIVPIPDMILLLQRNGKRMLPKADFDKLQNWAEKEFRDEEIQLSLWRCLNEEK